MKVFGTLRGQGCRNVLDRRIPHVFKFSTDQMLDYRGVVLSDPIDALAHLQLAKAYTLSGEANKAKSACQDFLALWNDADPDIPILKQAKTEYAKLQ